jgi:hypothetical protein
MPLAGPRAWRLTTALIVGLALSSASCGHDQRPAPVSADQLCSSLTIDEMREAFDLPFVKVRDVGRGCLFEQKDRQALSIGFTPYETEPGVDFDWYVDAAKRHYNGEDGDLLPHIGDGAFVTTGTLYDDGTVVNGLGILNLGRFALHIFVGQATNKLSADRLHARAVEALEFAAWRTKPETGGNQGS